MLLYQKNLKWRRRRAGTQIENQSDEVEILENDLNDLADDGDCIEDESALGYEMS